MYLENYPWIFLLKKRGDFMPTYKYKIQHFIFLFFCIVGIRSPSLLTPYPYLSMYVIKADDKVHLLFYHG
jgi:hypothetical protein